MLNFESSIFNWSQVSPVESSIDYAVAPETLEEVQTPPRSNSVELALLHSNPMVANNPITETFAQAAMHAGKPIGTMTDGWFVDGEELVFSPFRTTGNVRISIPYSEHGREFLETSTTLMDTYALALLGLYWSKHKEQPAVISIDEVLKAIDFSKYGVDRDKRAEAISDELNWLSKFDLQYSKLVGRVQLKKGGGKKQQQGKGVVSFSGDHLFSLVRMMVHAENHSRAFWNIKPGQWAYYYLNDDQFCWVSKLPRVILGLDGRPQRPADYFGKKLAYSLVGFSGGTTTAKGPFKRNIANLLCAIGELPLPEKRDNKWASRTKARMEKGLHRLIEMNILSHADYEATSMKTSNRYWVKSWLNSNLSIQLHQSLQIRTYKPRSKKNVESK
ncbi:hypothetical protein [Desulfonatronum parangueonense]